MRIPTGTSSRKARKNDCGPQTQIQYTITFLFFNNIFYLTVDETLLIDKEENCHTSKIVPFKFCACKRGCMFQMHVLLFQNLLLKIINSAIHCWRIQNHVTNKLFLF